MAQLMDHVCEIEMKHPDGAAAHSFSPMEYPSSVSQLHDNDAETRSKRVKDGVQALDPSRRYLPCYYFDYIRGTSTGA